MDAYSQEASPIAANLCQSQPETGIQLAYEFSALQVTAKRKKALKGSVVVGEFKGWLRLRWSYAGKRYTLSVGLPEGKINRVVAERKAKLIERDLLTETFDPTLAKYKTQPLTSNEIGVVEVFEKFIEYKRKQYRGSNFSHTGFAAEPKT
jgi:Arm DNA-binding domain